MTDLPDPRPISIWQPAYDKNGRLQFVRPEPSPLGDHYAAQRIISAQKKAGHTRICFFGESVAAGYLYAPHITPAKVLQHHLNTAVSQPQYELIDLARTNERLDTLVATVEASLQLNPDLLVIFAGNNWNLLETPEISPYSPDQKMREAYATALRNDGLLGPVELAAKHLMEKVSHAYGRLHTLAQTANIPLIWIIPEVNLADWETRQPAPWLEAGQNQRWYACYFAAQTAIEQKDWETVFALVDEMLTLDNKQCATSWQLLAIAHQGVDNEAQARLAAELAISHTNYATLGFLAAPQISAMEQELQRRMAAFYQFRTVDLPKLLPQVTQSHLPDKALFADYCHLTEQGMHLTMGAVAAEILQRPFPDLLTTLTQHPIQPTDLATAQFGAAIHTAHRHLPVRQNHEMVRYWCEQAYRTAPSIISAMVDYVATRTPIPAVLTAVQQQNLNSPHTLQHQHGWQYGHLDAILIEAVCTLLAEKEPTMYSQLLDHLIQQHGIGAAKMDLLTNDFYLWEPLTRFYPEIMPTADITEWAIHRAPWPETSLALVAQGKTAVNLNITARLPRFNQRPVTRQGNAALQINKQPLTHIALTVEWQTTSVTIPAGLLQTGLNKLTIQWPPLPNMDGFIPIIERLEQGQSADLYPAFGELFQVTCKSQKLF